MVIRPLFLLIALPMVILPYLMAGFSRIKIHQWWLAAIGRDNAMSKLLAAQIKIIELTNKINDLK